MSEQNEATIRQQTLLLIARNYGKEYVIKRVLLRFKKCIKMDFKIQLRIPSI